MERIVLAVLVIASAVAFLVPTFRRYQLVAVGKGPWTIDRAGDRISRFVSEVLFQSKIIRERPAAGLMHAFVFWGFLAFAVETLDHFVSGFGGTVLGHGAVDQVVSIVLVPFSLLVLVGTVSLAYRRAVIRPAALGKFSMESMVVATFISILMITYLLPQLGLVDEASAAGRINWWTHALVILVFLPLIVHSKHLHLVLSPVTTFLKDFELARIRPLDFENEEFGAEKLGDLSRHTLLGAFTCVECGRCQDHCPAFNTGKVLNPKRIMLDLEDGLLAASDPASAREREVVAEGILSADALWQCTTCGACTDQCPVGIDQVVPILDLRRGLVANGAFPSTFTTFFKNMETAGNPWAYPAHSAEEYLESEKHPAFDAEEVEVLYWMGCMARYDDTYRKISRDFTRVLDAAGVKWGVLESECCTGDAARRAGNEFIFSAQAEQNIELLNTAKPRHIVSTCPHCIRSIDEYRDFGLDASIRISHHTELIADLMAAGRIPQKESAERQKTAYHDPCYLSRYRKPEGVSAPRRVLRESGAELQEPERTGTRSFCCGAGGAMLFAEETEGKRINHERVDELLGTGASSVAVGCPFCRIMLADGLADRGRDDVAVEDVAQVVASRLPDAS